MLSSTTASTPTSSPMFSSSKHPQPQVVSPTLMMFALPAEAIAAVALADLHRQPSRSACESSVVSVDTTSSAASPISTMQSKVVLHRASSLSSRNLMNLYKMRRIGGQPLARPPMVGNMAAMIASKQRRLQRERQQQQQQFKSLAPLPVEPLQSLTTTSTSSPTTHKKLAEVTAKLAISRLVEAASRPSLVPC